MELRARRQEQVLSCCSFWRTPCCRVSLQIDCYTLVHTLL